MCCRVVKSFVLIVKIKIRHARTGQCHRDRRIMEKDDYMYYKGGRKGWQERVLEEREQEVELCCVQPVPLPALLLLPPSQLKLYSRIFLLQVGDLLLQAHHLRVLQT